jgi:hypothetical protein
MMPTFPDCPEETPVYAKPWRNPAAPPNPRPMVRYDNIASFSDRMGRSLTERIKFVTDQIKDKA